MTTRIHSFRLEAVVLKHNDWGEADRMLGLFSLEMGKQRALAKGVRRARSRKAGHLEPFTRVQLLLAHGRDMLMVTQAETLNAYLPLRDSLLLTSYAAYVIELLDRFTYEEGENRGLYRLLVETLERLCASPYPDLVVRYYEVRLLDLSGFRPQLFQCVRCGSEIRAEDQFFSAELGGAVCANCGRQVAGSRPISMEALRYLRHFQRSSYSLAASVSLPATVNQEMESLIQHYLTYLLERNLNTPAFLRRARLKPED